MYIYVCVCVCVCIHLNVYKLMTDIKLLLLHINSLNHSTVCKQCLIENRIIHVE